jgi:hypothetical protein
MNETCGSYPLFSVRATAPDYQNADDFADGMDDEMGSAEESPDDEDEWEFIR